VGLSRGKRAIWHAGGPVSWCDSFPKEFLIPRMETCHRRQSITPTHLYPEHSKKKEPRPYAGALKESSHESYLEIKVP